MLVNIVAVNPEIMTAKNGKTYKALTVTYKNDQGKTESKVLRAFGAVAKVIEVLEEAKFGDKFDIKTEKNDAGYWDWVGASPSNGAPSQSNSPAASSPAASSNSRSSGWQGETSEERSKKQLYIIRQSSLERATETLSVGSKAPLDPSKVIEVANIYAQYVLDTSLPPLTAPAKAETGSIGDLPDDDIEF